MNKFLKFLAFASSAVLLVVGFPSSSIATEPSSEPKPPCRIQVSHAHISNWIFTHEGYRAVKVDAFSRCNVPQSKVTLTVEIWKLETFGKIRVARTYVKSPGVTFPGKDVENFKTFRRCKSHEMTKYYGVAYAKAFIQGKWQVAMDTYSTDVQTLACGT